jgi:hypothetical protein
MHSNSWRSHWLFVLLMCSGQLAFAATTFNVDVQTHTEPRNAASKGPPDVHYQAKLIFSDTTLAVRTASAETVYDFANRRRIVIDLDAKTYVRYSLFDTLGFRVLELQNRERIAKGLATQNDSVPQPSIADIEHVLSIASSTPAKLSQSFDDGAVVFAGDGHEMARWTDVGVEANASDMKNFVRFIRYSTGGHPQILEQLAARHSIPNQLTFTFNQVFGVTTSHIAVSGRSSADWPQDYLAGYNLAGPVGNETDSVLNRADRLSAKDADDAARRSLAELKADEAARLPLPIFLDVNEANLITGTAPPVTDDAKTLMQADPAVVLAASALGAKSEGDLQKAIQTFTDLRQKAGAKGYVLEIFEANDRVHLGDGSASKMFNDVLQKNPAIGSVYKDYGDFFLIRYDLARAWRCWDIGRRLAPQFANFAPVTEFEKSLVSQHPEYF